MTLLNGKRYLLCYIVLSYQSSIVSDLEEGRGDQTTERLMVVLFIVTDLSPSSRARICAVPYIW